MQEQPMLGPGTIDPDALRRAEAVVERYRATYIHEWAPAALDEMEATVMQICRYAKDPDCAPNLLNEQRDRLGRLAHDMKGQAGTFGLELLHDFAASLYDVAASAKRVRERQAEIFLGLVMAMRTALSAATNSPDGTIAAGIERELRRSLRAIARRGLN